MEQDNQREGPDWLIRGSSRMNRFVKFFLSNAKQVPMQKKILWIRIWTALLPFYSCVTMVFLAKRFINSYLDIKI